MGMAQYTSFGYDFTSPGHSVWAFVFVSDPFLSSYDSANSNSGRLVYNNSDGTKTFINGTGLANGANIAWTTLTSLEHVAASGSTVLERIDNLGATGANPGSSGPGSLAGLLLNGIDTFTGSSGTDAVRSGDGADTLFGGAGADRLEGGTGNDTFRLTAGDFVAGESIVGDNSGVDHGTDTLQLENVGNLDLRIGSVGGIDTVNFFSGTSSLTVDGDGVGGTDQFKTFIGSAGADTVTFANAAGHNFSGLVFTNWTPGQDTINILTGANNSTTGTSQNDTFFLSGRANMDGGQGDDVFILDATSVPGDIAGGAGTDTIKLRSATYDFTSMVLSGVEQLIFDTGTSTATFNQAKINAGVVPAIVGSANVDAVVISGFGTIDASTLVLTSWTEGVDTLTLTDTAHAATAFTGSSHRDTILGNDNADILNGKGGADSLFGGTEADKFVFDAVALSDAQSAIFDTVKDYDQGGGAAYNFGEGDQIDLSALLSTAYNHGSGQAVSSLVRAVEDAGGTFANLQIDTDGTANGVNFITIARLDGIQAGNGVNVILDSTIPAGSTITSTVPSGSVSINDVSISEGNSGTKIETFTVTRTGGTAAFDVNFGTTDNSATVADSDYVATSGTLHFGTGVNTQTISVTINGDTRPESDEAFAVNLSGATNGATISDGLGIGTVTNDDIFPHAPTHDFNGDGKSDILWRSDGGTLVSWDVNDGQVIRTNDFGGVPSNWTMTGTGDFNGDGKVDLLWRSAAGTLVSWDLNDGQVLRTNDFGVVPSNWQVVGTGDFNGDGKSDFLWRSDAGTLVTWDINDGQVLRTNDFGQVPTNWKIAGTGDFNGDGKSDLVLRSDAGTLVTWDMNDGQVLRTNDFGVVPSNWKIAGTGDFNGDGKSDLVLRSDAGTLVTWDLNDGQVLATHDFGVVPSNWKIAGTGDFNGDGKSDLLWRSDAGTVVTWNINDGQVLGTHDFGVAPTDWHII
jgi:Ca2+-binding RTX toxin-like protein